MALPEVRDPASSPRFVATIFPLPTLGAPPGASGSGRPRETQNSLWPTRISTFFASVPPPATTLAFFFASSR